MPHTILITGSSGAVGAPVVERLLERGHTVRGLNRRETDGPETSFKGDIADQAAVREAMTGCDRVIHLAAYPDDAAFLEKLLEPNVIGLFNVMHVARELHVPRVVLASTVQVVSGVKKETVLTSEDAAPTNHYALTKVWAERMGEMYARRYEMQVIAARIGWLTRTPEEAARLEKRGAYDVFLSHDDAARFFTAAVEADLPPSAFHILYAYSKPKNTPRVDLASAKRIIGYDPQDVFPQGLTFEWPPQA